MAGRFDRFDDRAKRVLALAQDEAIRLNHNYIGPEHLLLGLVCEGGGAAARALDALGVELAKVRRAVESTVRGGDATSSPSRIVLLPGTKKIIELAVDESRRLGHSYVGTEHLLLGLVREGASDAAGVLAALGVTAEKVRHQVTATLGQPAAAAGDAPREPRQYGRAASDAQGVLTAARQEALSLGHDWLGSEHLLLALLRPTFPVTAKTLARLGVTYESALAEIVAIVPRRDTKATEAQLTPRMYGLIGYARGFSDGAGAALGAATLLVALVAEPDSVAAQVLARLGATAERVRAAVDELLTRGA